MHFTKIINNLIEEIKSYGVMPERMNNKDIQLLKEFINLQEHIIWVNDFAQAVPSFVNTAAKDYYGYTDEMIEQLGFDLYKDLLHPDHFNDVHNTMTFFAESPKGVFIHPYRVKAKDKSWKWTYSAAKPLSYMKDGVPKYIIAIVFDIDELVQYRFLEKANSTINADFIKLHKERYDRITPREIDVLKSIGKGLSNTEIGDQLNIVEATVSSHRNNLFEKLGVRNSRELVKFAILFHPEII